MKTRLWNGCALAAALVATILAVPGAARASNSAGEDRAEAGEDARLRLIVSREAQQIDVYRGTELLVSSPVSTGKRGHETPLGIYSILDKRRWHRSNIYSAAPMPFMQRITWSGIALHEGHVPGHPASHGCIRLPAKFAKKLFGMTEVGADVLITRAPARPVPITHQALFQPGMPMIAVALNELPGKARRASDAAGLDLDVSGDGLGGGTAARERSTAPLRILITRRTGRQRVMDIQRLLHRLGYDPGEVDGYLGSNTGGAIQAFQRATGARATGMVTDELISALYRAADEEEVKGHIYVRQDYRDLFDAPVRIRDFDAPLGTHFFSASVIEKGRPADWMVVTVAGESGADPRAVLDRITIPDEVRARIHELLTPGSSMVISDAGLGRETGKGTDFIVQPH